MRGEQAKTERQRAGGRNSCRPMTPLLLLAGLLLLPALLAGCALEPKGTEEEREKVAQAGQIYQRPFAQRDLPELPAQPTWQDVLQRAFYANGDLEAAYFEWRAAVERIGPASAYPNSNVQIGFDYMFSREKMKSWDRTTISVGFDPAMMLQWPEKVRKAGKIALEDARVRGLRFAGVKFDLQQKVLKAWLEQALMAEMLRIENENVDLLQMLADTAVQRVRTGGPQQDLLKAQTELEMARNEQATMAAQLSAMRAMLNGMLARPADAPLPPPATLPAPRPLTASDPQLIAVAVDANPELAGLARTVAGRQDALELARLAYIPDFSPQFSATGSIAQAVGAMISLPTNLVRIRGSIQEAKSMLRATEAMARQTRSDRAASFVATLYALRNSERQAALFKDVILPKAQQMFTASLQAYATGTLPFAELVDSQRTLLEVRRLSAQARIAREQRLAELEPLAGLDIESLAQAATQPAAKPSSLAPAPRN